VSEPLDNPFGPNEPRRVVLGDEEPRRGKKRTSRKLAEENADKLIELMWPKAPVARAGKRIQWIYDRKRGDRFPIQLAEDLFGVFDRIVVSSTGLIAVQATVHEVGGSSGVSARRRKIERDFITPLRLSMGESGDHRDYLADRFGAWLKIEVWGWEPRYAMHVWAWSWALADWRREPKVWRVKKGELVAEAPR
jgi:hypothetical protein